MINEKYHAPDGRGLQLAVPVPATAQPGIPLMVQDMKVVPQSPRATPELRAAGKVAQGLRDGWASCFIPGTSQVLDLGEMPAGVQVGQRIYLDALTGKPTLTSAGNLEVGFAVITPGYNGGMFVAVTGN